MHVLDERPALFFAGANREKAKFSTGIFLTAVQIDAARERGRIEGEEMLAQLRAGLFFQQRADALRNGCGLSPEDMR